MKFTVKKGDLEAAVQIATIGIGGGSDDADIAGHLLIRVRNGIAEMVASNGTRLVAGGPIVGAVVSEAEDGMAFTVPAWRLRDFLSSLGGNETEITLTYEGGVVIVSVAKKPVGKWGSLDPKNFTVVDDTLASATDAGRVVSSRFTNLLSYARRFVSDQETRHPPLVAVECRDGVLHATDSVGVAMVKSDILEKCRLRVHGKDVAALISFLALKGSQEVNLLEHDRCLFVQRDDGWFLCIGRWPHEFPILKIKKEEPPRCTFSIATEALVGAIKCLGAFAKKDDTHLHFRFDEGNVVLSMESASGDAELAEQVIPCLTQEHLDQFQIDGYKEFILSKRFVEVIADAADDQPIEFGVNWVKSNGFVTIKSTDGGDEFFTLIVWIRKK